MKNKILVWVSGGLMLALTACGTTGSGTTPEAEANVEAALPMVRMGAAVATGGVLDFAVQSSVARSRLANEMYAAAQAVYSLSDGSVPTPGQFEACIVAFGGTQTEAKYAKFATVIGALYAAYYPKLVTGEAKTAADFLNALAGGIEDATRAYVTTPLVAASMEEPVSF